MKKRIAIITARGGSKRIPGKNIREFCGKPIISYGIEAAIKSGMFDEVMVSTDSKEIKEVAEKFGAKVPFMRSEENSNDYATTVDVIKEVIMQYKKNGEEFDTIACIYPTAPFISADKLIKAVEKLENTGSTEVMPVVRFSYPPQRGYVLNDGYIMMKHPEYRERRSQDIEPVYHDVGQFYCFDTQKFLECDGKITDGISPIIVDELEVQDIDNETDWKIAEMKYKIINGL